MGAGGDGGMAGCCSGKVIGSPIQQCISSDIIANCHGQVQFRALLLLKLLFVLLHEFIIFHAVISSKSKSVNDHLDLYRYFWALGIKTIDTDCSVWHIVLMKENQKTMMKYAVLFVLLLLAIFLLAAVAQSTPNITQLAESIVDALSHSDVAAVSPHLSDLMKTQLPGDKLGQIWGQLTEQCGTFKARTGTRMSTELGYDCVYVTCRFEKSTLDAKLVFDKEGKLSGLWFAPAASANNVRYTPPAYVQPECFTEREITVGAGKWKLPGTLTLPKGQGPFPAVVLVHGSGPNDRDETVGANKPFRDLAWGLASRGIAVLRYDKRTKVYAADIAKSDAHFTVKEETIDDALVAVDVLRHSDRIDPKRIFVLGHSLGGMLIPRIGKAAPHLAGLIIMAGATRPLEDIILEQMTYLAALNGPPTAETEKQLDEVRHNVALVKSRRLSHTSPSLFNAPPSYWLDLRHYHPAEVAKSLKQPLLILQGGRDYQVTQADYQGWMKALSGKPTVTFKIYTTLNHLFAEGTGKSVPQEYQQRVPVAPSVIDDLVAWITNIR